MCADTWAWRPCGASCRVRSNMPLPSINDPVLGKEHLDAINVGLAHVEVAKHRIKLAKQAGFDMTQEEADLAKHEGVLRRTKQTYFPGQT